MWEMVGIFNDFVTGAGKVIDGWAWLSGEASATVINQSIGVTRTRPHPWSTFTDYTSWQGLTDRTYLARHLPPADVPVKPAESKVQELFRRPAGQQRLSTKSTCLFPAFAQYLTDGFIRSDPSDPRRTTSNHEIDLCPLYGRKPAQTDALRLKSVEAGRKGRLKSQINGGEEYPPLLYPNGDGVPDPQFAPLDPPLLPRDAPPPQPDDLTTIFAVGGDRVNSTPFSMMMNTLLLREHNRVAGALEAQNPLWDDERVFQTARNIVICMFIKVVIEQYINHITPLPFGLRADPKVASKANWNRPNWMTVEFSLLYRWHSLMPDVIEWPTGDIPIGQFKFNNRPLLDVGLDAAFSAASKQKSAALGAFNTADALLPVEQRAVLQARINRINLQQAVVNLAGSWAWAAWATTLATIGSPSFSATLCRVITSAAAPSEIDEAVGRGDRAVLDEGGLQRGILSGRALPGCSSTERSSRPCGWSPRRADLALEGAAGDRRIGPLERAQRIGVLLLAGELIFAHRILGEDAHRLALVIGVLEPVEEHRVLDHVMAHARAGAMLRQQIGRARHALHAARDDDVGAAGRERVMRHDRRLHARAAHLVDRRRLDRLRQPGAERRLARRRLAEAGGQHAAHDNLLDRSPDTPARSTAALTAAAPSSVEDTSPNTPIIPPIGVLA